MNTKKTYIGCTAAFSLLFAININAAIVNFQDVASGIYSSYTESSLTITGSSNLIFGSKGLGVDGGISFGGTDPFARYNLLDSGESLTFSFAPGLVATNVRLWKNGFDFGDATYFDGLIFTGYDSLGNEYSGTLDVGTATGGTGWQNVMGYGNSPILGLNSLTQFSITAPDDGYSYEFIEFQLEVATVPLPAAFWLFGSGLLCLAGFSRRKYKNT